MKNGGGYRMQPQVKIYTLSTCIHCKATKQFLNACRVQFEFKDVDLLDGKERNDVLEEVKKINKACTFPTMIIGDKVIVGYNEGKIREALGL